MIRSTLANLPIYFLSPITIPAETVQQLESIQCRFLWGDEEGSRKYHLVNWGDVKKLIKQGGLGIKSLTELNTALRAFGYGDSSKKRIDYGERLLWANGEIFRTERGLAELGGSMVLVCGGKF